MCVKTTKILQIFVPWTRNVFIPSFLGCWTGRIIFERILVFIRPFIINQLNAESKYLFKYKNDMNRATHNSQSALYQHMLLLVSTLVCLLFTRWILISVMKIEVMNVIWSYSTCGIQHFQRAGQKNLNLFESFYLTIVTFSTVGYGEIYPDIWISQLLIIVIICVAFAVLPTQVR